MATENSNGFFAFLGGAVVGGIAALLLAPERGTKLRSRLKERISRLSDGVYLDEEQVRRMVDEKVEQVVDDMLPEPTAD